ncbi:hypothetical protein J3454_15955 [Erythrobacter sp. NFXS35]|uniref:hypothetical protein n=1 Tax=Erythrobacter sp. NFXS35 TaxID=2818436 RepID=UPI0032DECFD3
MTIPAVLFPEQSIDRRKAERFRVRFGTVSQDLGPEALDMTVHDVSRSGFLMETDKSLPANTCLVVELKDAGFRLCKIVWNNGRFHGAVFADPLNSSELQRLVARSPIVWPNFGEENSPAVSDRVTDPGPPCHDDPDVQTEYKLPLATRGRIIVGSAALLWAVIGAAVWLAIG